MKTLIKAFKILDLFTSDRPALTFSEVVALSGVNKTSTHGLLQTLVSLNCLTRQDNYYRPGPKLFELGSLFVSQLDLRQVALPHLIELSHQTQDTVYLCVLDKEEALCLARVDGKYQVRVLALLLGGRLPLHVGATPTILLSAMPDHEIERIAAEKGFKKYTENTIGNLDELMEKVRLVRRQGYSISWEDVTINVAAIGAPLIDYSGQVVGAICVGSIVQRYEDGRLHFIIESVVDTAQKISSELGATWTGDHLPVNHHFAPGNKRGRLRYQIAD